MTALAPEEKQEASGTLGADALAARTRAAQARGWTPPFRGTITDYARGIELGHGYILPDDHVCRNCAARGIAHCRHFEIETCRQLAGPFAAIHDPNVWLTMVMKATQTLGSLTWDMTLHYLIVHSRFVRIKIFIDSDEKARKYCDERLMDTLKRNPDIAPMLPTGDKARHDDRKTEIKFTNGKSIVICGLNDSNASSLPGDFVVIDEGWIHANDGLMKKAVDRTKQVGYRKVLIVGRAGRTDEDQDVLWNKLDKRVGCSWACPCCGGRQEFGDGSHGTALLRPPDFAPRVVTPEEWSAVSSSLVSLGELPLPPSPPKPGTYAGLRLDRSLGEIKTPEDVKAAAAGAFLECFHCGFQIPDTKPMRAALMASYEQEYRVPGPHGFYTPQNYSVGFWNPDPVSVTVPFRATMEDYIIAKKSDKLGNRIPLETFYMDRWARPWNESLGREFAAPLPMNLFDAETPLPGEVVRLAALDIQDKVTNAWNQIWAIGEGSTMRLLWWEHIVPPLGLTLLEKRQWVKRAAEQSWSEFKVQPQNVSIDIAHEPEEIYQWAAEKRVLNGKLKKLSGERTNQDIFYNLVRGDDAKGYKHKVRGSQYVWAGFSPKFYEQVVILNAAGQREAVKVPYRLMSTNRTQQVAQRFIEQDDAPKLEIPQFIKHANKVIPILADKSLNGLWAQLNSEVKVPKKGKIFWERVHQRPNHGRDCFRMVLKRMEECGLLMFAGKAEAEPDGSAATGEEEEGEET